MQRRRRRHITSSDVSDDKVVGKNMSCVTDPDHLLICRGVDDTLSLSDDISLSSDVADDEVVEGKNMSRAKNIFAPSAPKTTTPRAPKTIRFFVVCARAICARVRALTSYAFRDMYL